MPPSSIPEMLRRVDAIGGAPAPARPRRSATPGDGNLHINLLSNEDPREPAVAARIDAALAEIFRATLDLGGTLSGEHGIGIAKARYMAWEQSRRGHRLAEAAQAPVGSAGPAQPREDLRRLIGDDAASGDQGTNAMLSIVTSTEQALFGPPSGRASTANCQSRPVNLPLSTLCTGAPPTGRRTGQSGRWR